MPFKVKGQRSKVNGLHGLFAGLSAEIPKVSSLFGRYVGCTSAGISGRGLRVNSISRQIWSWALAVFAAAAVVTALTGLLLDRAADTGTPVDLIQSVLTVRH